MKRRKRDIYYICSSIINNDLISEAIIADSYDTAIQLFLDKFQSKPRIVHGPFFKKKVHQVIVTTQFKVTSKIKKAYYNDWLVNAIFLKEPENMALLIFVSHTNNKTVSPPTGITIVPLNDLRFI